MSYYCCCRCYRLVVIDVAVATDVDVVEDDDDRNHRKANDFSEFSQ